MGMEYRLQFRYREPETLATLLRRLPFAHEREPQTGVFELRAGRPDGRMPDAAAQAQPYGLYFCDKGGAGREFLGKLLARLVSEFGAVTVSELEDGGPCNPPAEVPGAAACVITSAGNTVVPAYLALLHRGYRVRREETPGPEELWRADGPECTLVAEDPVTLLGLAALYEARGRDWTASDAEIDAFLEQFPQEDGNA